VNVFSLHHGYFSTIIFLIWVLFCVVENFKSIRGTMEHGLKNCNRAFIDITRYILTSLI